MTGAYLAGAVIGSALAGAVIYAVCAWVVRKLGENQARPWAAWIVSCATVGLLMAFVHGNPTALATGLYLGGVTLWAVVDHVRLLSRKRAPGT